MNKLISRALLLSMIMYLCLPIANYVYAKENTNVIINDVCIDDDAYVEVVGEKLYVSARNIAEPMGLNLDWNDISKTLRIFHQDRVISLITASNLAIVDNTPIQTQQPLKIVSDRAVVDLGFLCDTLEVPMTFDEYENSYRITIDVPKDFQPDVTKTDNSLNEISLFSNDNLEISKVKDIANDLGLKTVWDDTEKSLTLTSEPGDTLTLYVANDVAWFNDTMVDCPNPMKIIDDEAYIEYEFVEKFFTIPTPQNYIPIRQIADELGSSVKWIDETKTVELVNGNGDTLCMSVGSSYYVLNGKYYQNSAPLILKNGVAFTDRAVVEDAFVNQAANTQNDELSLFSSSKDFSGQLIFEKSFTSSTQIKVTVISVQSIVYSNAYGYTYSDYNSKTITVPANTNSVDFSVTKTGCNTSDSYIIGYSFLNSNSYYYTTGYLSNTGGITTYLSSYMGYYTKFNYYSTTSDIIIKPKIRSDVILDDAVFSGTIKTGNDIRFGSDSSLVVSVRSMTYYTESIIASETLYPGNKSSAEFSVSIPNNANTRNKALYLHYSLYNGNDNIIPSGYYNSPTSSVKNRGDASAFYIPDDILSNISFTVLSKLETTIRGSFYLPDNIKNNGNSSISLGMDIQTVHSNIYSQKIFYLYESFDNVAEIKPGANKADYTLPVALDKDDLYILKYRLLTPYREIFPYGYATDSSNMNNPNYATIYTSTSDFNKVDFHLNSTANSYHYINNLPYRNDGSIVSSSNLSERNTYYEGYCIYLSAGQTITIEMKASLFDSYLYLLDEHMSVIASDDDGLGNRNSKISKYINSSGYYYIQATTYNSNATGKYSITITTDKPLSGSVKFTDDDQNVIGAITGNSVIQANYTIQNTGSMPEDVYLFMALYDTNNVLISIKSKKISVSDISDTESLSMYLNNIDNVGKIKTYMWTDELIPIGNADYLYK